MRFCATVALACVSAVCFATSVDYSLPVEEMFDKADLVAVVEITASDSTSFETWLYQARIIQSIKGGSGGQVIYFGNVESYQDTAEASYRLQGEYLVFLVQSTTTLDQRRTTAAGPWVEDGQQALYQHTCANRTVLPIEHVYDGETWAYRVGIHTSCFKLPTELVVLELEPNGHITTSHWVTKDQLLSLLRTRGSGE